MLLTKKAWDEKYMSPSIPWEANIPEPYLVSIIDSGITIMPKTALDIGCGMGTNSIFLAERGFEVTAVDLSKVAIDAARVRARNAGQKVSFLNKNFLEFEKDAKFGFILDRRVFHFFDPEERPIYVEKVFQLLEDKGKFLLIVSSNFELGDNRYHFTKEQLEEIFRKFKFFSVELIELKDHMERPKSWAVIMKK